MEWSAGVSARQHAEFEAYGVRVRISADDPDVFDRLPPLLPPGSKRSSSGDVHESFGIVTDASGSYEFTRGGDRVIDGVGLDFALIMLENQLRMCVGVHAPNKIFIHAGVVAHEGRALVIPGLSFSGKTTLVVALMRAGATYYSDEFAVLDEHGLVHPYAKPLSVRDQDLNQNDHHVERFGGTAGEEPAPIGMVVFTEYRPGAEWNPTSLSPGRGVLAMFAHTLAARARASEAMRAIRRALDGTVLLEGARGEADVLAHQLLDSVSTNR